MLCYPGSYRWDESSPLPEETSLKALYHYEGTGTRNNRRQAKGYATPDFSGSLPSPSSSEEVSAKQQYSCVVSQTGS